MKSNPKRDAVLAAYRSNPGATLTEYCTMTGIKSANGVRHYLMSLTKAGAITWTPRERGNQGTGIDRRKYNSDETMQKKTIAGRKGRGADIHTYKNDPELEKRLKRIERRAKRKQKAQGSNDVVRGDHIIRLNGLRASRVG